MFCVWVPAPQNSSFSALVHAHVRLLMRDCHVAGGSQQVRGVGDIPWHGGVETQGSDQGLRLHYMVYVNMYLYSVVCGNTSILVNARGCNLEKPARVIDFESLQLKESHSSVQDSLQASPQKPMTSSLALAISLPCLVYYHHFI